MLDHEKYAREHALLRPVQTADSCTLGPLLATLSGHTLQEQEVVTLADRTDSKFLMPIAVLSPFLQALHGDYTVLQSAGHRIFTYQNTYFDTPSLALYQAHHNGKRNRYKCRHRRYLETDVAFLELKLKSNKLRTVKNRLPWPLPNGTESLDLDPPVQPSLYVNYLRISLWNRAVDERLTVDLDLCFARPDEGRVVRLPGVFIAELKRQGKVHGSPFVRRAKEHGFLPSSISKYCVGLCLTDSGGLKKNRFKPLLRQLGDVMTIGELFP
jgi:hypothetical protein